VQDLSRNFYIFDGYNYVVRKVDYATNLTYRFVGDGTGVAGFAGDGGQATSARINVAVSGCVDSNNNLLIADTYNHRIRRVNARTSTITTIAGTGTAGFSGDGAAATAARLNFPRSVAVDYSTGDIYISDMSNNRIRRIAASNGFIYTVAGTGAAGAGGDEGLAVAATLNQPNTILFEQSSKNLYIADEANQRIRVVDTSTGYIYLFCGFGPNLPDCQGDPECPLLHASLTTFSNPHSLEVTPEGDIYITQSGNNPLIRKIDHATGAISNVVGTGVSGWTGDGPALSIRLNQPGSMAYASTTSTLYFSDAGNARVRYYHLPTGQVSTLAGTGTFDYNGTGAGPQTHINYPQGIALDPAQTNLYVGDYSNYLIRRVNLATQFVENFAGTPGDTSAPTYGVPATTTTIRYPDGLATTCNGDLYIAGLRGLERIAASNNEISLVAASNSLFRGDRKLLNSTNTFVNAPKGVRVDASDALILSDNSNFRIRKTYSSGFINAVKYLNLSAQYRWGRSNTLGSIVMNGTTIFSYDGITGQDSTFTLTNYDVETLPIASVDPVRFTNTPWFSIDLRSSDGYSQLTGTAWMVQYPGQGESTVSLVDCNGGLQLNTGILRWPSSVGGIVLSNQYNDLETRTITYTGALTFASDPYVKEQVEPASLGLCISSFSALPLKRYQYSPAYRSTFHTQDIHRLGFLTTDVAPILPKSITRIPLEQSWISTPVHGLDTSQIRYLHLGTTQRLLQEVSTLEAEVATLTRAVATQRTTVPR
jgi:sugar lactone lactonase YvrE